jgi:hypothetical protein
MGCVDGLCQPVQALLKGLRDMDDVVLFRSMVGSILLVLKN